MLRHYLTDLSLNCCSLSCFVMYYNNNWRAPWKGGVSTYFTAIFQVARNPLKFGMPTLFVLEDVHLFFFLRRQKNMDKIVQKCPPPPRLSLSISKQRRISILESQNTVCVLLYWEEEKGREEGERKNFQECVWSLVSLLVEKKTGTFFNTKRVGMQNISGFLATWKIPTK